MGGRGSIYESMKGDNKDTENLKIVCDDVGKRIAKNPNFNFTK